MVRILRKVFSCCTGRGDERQKGEDIEITEVTRVNTRTNTEAGDQRAIGGESNGRRKEGVNATSKAQETTPEHQTASFKSRSADPFQANGDPRGPVQKYMANATKPGSGPDEIESVQTTKSMHINVKQCLDDRERLFARLRRPDSATSAATLSERMVSLPIAASFPPTGIFST